MYKLFQRTNIAEMRPYQVGESMEGISVSQADAIDGSPKAGDMIARNPSNHADQWLVAERYFLDNFAGIDDQEESSLDHQKRTEGTGYRSVGKTGTCPR